MGKKLIGGNLTSGDEVSWGDFSIFSSYWLEEGLYMPADLNRDQIVDWSDFSIFAANWLWGT